MAEDFNLGRGESEAITLVLQEKAQLVGIDDKNGIQACKLTGTPFVTAVGNLVRRRSAADQEDYRQSLVNVAKIW